jgi:hypothetical protein
MGSLKGAHFEKDILLTCVRWYVVYPLRYRPLEGRMEERGGQSAMRPSIGGAWSTRRSSRRLAGLEVATVVIREGDPLRENILPSLTLYEFCCVCYDRVRAQRLRHHTARSTYAR